MSKETAVDWLVDAMRNNLAAGKLNAVCISGLKMHAKAVEKEQIKEAYANGHEDGLSYMNNILQDFKNAEEFYNETYK
jgi:hypothetical protein